MATGTPAVQFATTSDGVRIAYVDTGGEGWPLLWTPGWVSHIEMAWHDSDVGLFYRRLAGRHRFVHFDGRGTGLSDREVDDLSTAARVRDLEAVVDALGLDQFDLFAWSFWGPVGITYAAQHPERIGRLALYATFARFQGGSPELGHALVDLIRAEWSVGSRAITEFVHPSVEHTHEQAFATYFRASATGDVAAAILEEGFFRVDVTSLLPRLTMPTIVMHRRDDSAVPEEATRELASGVPGARFIPLPGASRSVDAAIEIQRALAQHNADRADQTIHIRIGLNAGEPVREGDDLFGQAVQLACRISERARPGQILVADVVRHLAAGKGFRFVERGRVTLKGLSERVRLHEVAWGEKS